MDFEALLKLPKCDKCGQMIAGKMLKVHGKAYHDTCFTCAACSKSLAAGYQMEDRQPDQPEMPQHKPHCPECYGKIFTPVCKSCGQNIGDKSYVQACGGAWHDQCFVCTKCRQPLADGVKHYPVDDMPYCQKDYWEAKIQKQAKAAAAAQSKVQPAPVPAASSSRPPPPPKSYVQPPNKSVLNKSTIGKGVAKKQSLKTSFRQPPLKKTK